MNLKIFSTKQEQITHFIETLEKYVKEHIVEGDVSRDETLVRWTQAVVNAFYKKCETLNVIVKMNIEENKIELFGEVNKVKEAKRIYLEEKANQSEQARLDAIARNVMWAYAIGENLWEKFSREQNARIEDAYLSEQKQQVVL